PTHPRERRRQRVIRAARRQIGSGQTGKAEARVEIKGAVGGRHHLVVRAFLSEADRYTARQPLIQPDAVELHPPPRFVIANELVIPDHASLGAVAVYIEAADVEMRPRPIDGFFEVDIENAGGQAVVGGAALTATYEVCPNLALFLQRQLDARIGFGRARLIFFCIWVVFTFAFPLVAGGW